MNKGKKVSSDSVRADLLPDGPPSIFLPGAEKSVVPLISLQAFCFKSCKPALLRVLHNIGNSSSNLAKELLSILITDGGTTAKVPLADRLNHFITGVSALALCQNLVWMPSKGESDLSPKNI